MSQGHGKLQRFILGHVDANPTEVMPTPVLAAFYANQEGVPETKHQRAAVRRAVVKLADEGLLEIADLKMPTRMIEDKPLSYRQVLCCWKPGLNVKPGDDKHVTAASMLPLFTQPPTQ